ncbi:MAG: hypothetical protein AAGE52_16975 [Myxococcota bacterium]
MTDAPPRDPSIPADAIWDAERNEFGLHTFVAGQRQGESKWYRPDGSLCCISHHVDDQGHGPYQRFHQNGEVSQEGELFEGERHGRCIWQRSTGDTTENTIPDVAADNVWRAVIIFEHGIPYPSRYYDKADAEVLLNGEPVPARPEGVHEDAAFEPGDKNWFYGFGAQGHEQRHGLWQWWSSDGTPTLERLFERGKPLRERRFRADGSVEMESHYDAEGKRIYTARFDSSGARTTSAGDAVPPRPKSVSERAIFDTHGEHWMEAESLEDGVVRNGTWTWRKLDGSLAIEHEYQEGAQLADRKFHDNGKLFVERLKDLRGNKTRVAFFYDDGDLNYSIDRTYDGDTLTGVTIHRYQRGLIARGERKDGPGLRYEFFEKGEVTARGHVEDNKAVGTWEFFSEDEPFALDVTAHEIRASVDQRFRPTWVLGAALLEKESKAPLAEELRGANEVPWHDLTSCMGTAEGFAGYLQAMLSGVRAVRNTALGRIRDEALHQGTVYVATAQVVPFLLRILAHPNADTVAILSFVEDVTSSAATWLEEALGWEDDDEERIAIVGTVDAVKKGFPAIVAFADYEDVQVRASVLALAAFADDQGKDLVTRIANGNDAELRPVAVHTLLSLESSSPDDAVPFLNAKDDLVVCVAATTVALRFGPDSPPETTAALTASLSKRDDLAASYAGLPFTDGHLLVYLSLALGSVRTPEAMKLASDLALHLPRLGFHDAPSYCQGLFALCFGRGERPFAPGFLDVFDAIAKEEVFDGYVNFFEVAERWNLPRERRAYRGIAERLRKSDDAEALMHSIMHGEA